MRVQPWLVLGVVLCSSATVVEGAAPEPGIDDTTRTDITANMRVAVHVYTQVSDLSAEDELRALDVAGQVFSTASVDVAWTLCRPGMCLTPTTEALKVRIALSTDRTTSNPGVLGHALIDSQAHDGVLATVFLDRIRRLADQLSIDARRLLGRTIAHELGHLLLGTSMHGSGLMREIWSLDELLGTRREDWLLNPLDASAIRHRLARRSTGRSRGAS